MNRILLIVLVLFLFNCQTSTKEKRENPWLWDWIDAWTLVYQETFHLPDSKVPAMLFYDDAYVYTNADASSPEGIPFNGPELYNQSIQWKKQKHNDTLTFPNGQKVPIQLMTFAAPLDEGAFFVMPAPSYWKQVGLQSEVVTLDQMLTGIFVHEFAHTRQIEFIGEKISEFEKSGTYDYPVNDDIVQHYFEEDSNYTKAFKEELACLYKASALEDKQLVKEEARSCLEQIKNRHTLYLNPTNEKLIEMDGEFLTMEGLGQFAMLSWYTSPKGANLSMEEAIKATRHNKKWWSQDEGLALMLLYDRLAEDKDWSFLFKEDSEDLITKIENELD